MRGTPGNAEDLGRAIAALRGPRTQAEVARVAGLQKTHWGRFEKGKQLPREETLERITRGLGCSLAELEEARDRFRRERLLRLMAEAERAAALPDRPVPQGLTMIPEEARLEIRALTLRFARDLEELLLWVARAGR